MPIFEYQCEACDAVFERLVLRAAAETSPDCPRCSSANTSKRFSTFSTHSSGAAATAASVPPTFT